MIRIFTNTRPNAITITVDGQLVAEFLEPVVTSAHEAIEQDKPVHLFLRDVSHIDEDGRALLAQLAARGVQLSASGVYSSYIVDEVRREQARKASENGWLELGNMSRIR